MKIICPSARSGPLKSEDPAEVPMRLAVCRLTSTYVRECFKKAFLKLSTSGYSISVELGIHKKGDIYLSSIVAVLPHDSSDSCGAMSFALARCSFRLSENHFVYGVELREIERKDS